MNNIKTNNLKNLNINFPLGTFVCVTGVSGSGKSSLIIDTLYQRLDEYFNKSLNKNERNFNIKVNNIDKVIDIDQSPIGEHLDLIQRHILVALHQLEIGFQI